MLLANTTPAPYETVNDADHMLANFWRALQADPDAVAHHADWPINEVDLHARHLWLVSQKPSLTEQMANDPSYYDAKIAGWWVWGICSWIGHGWCREGRLAIQKPHLSARQGINCLHEYPTRTEYIHQRLQALAARLRDVRVCCGDWQRVCTPAVIGKRTTAVFLDPPYADTANRMADVYAVDSLSVAHDVREWAITNGEHSNMRIALCGYEGEHNMPDSWTCIPWKAQGGYGCQGDSLGRANAERERIWFSPHCHAL